MEKFDDVEESFHIDKDEASKAVVAVRDDGAEDERHKQQHAPFVAGAHVLDEADESSQKHDAHASSSGRLIATQSPSPRTDQQQYRHNQQQQQHGTSAPVQMSHALNSLDNAEAALALALQGLSPRLRVRVRPCCDYAYDYVHLCFCCVCRDYNAFCVGLLLRIGNCLPHNYSSFPSVRRSRVQRACQWRRRAGAVTNETQASRDSPQGDRKFKEQHGIQASFRLLFCFCRFSCSG